MTNKPLYYVLIILFIISPFIFIGCSESTINSQKTPGSSNTLPEVSATIDSQKSSATPTMKVRTDHLILNNGKEILIGGTVDIFNLTMQSQLFDCKNHLPLVWWPSNQDIKANGYFWKITVQLVDNGTPYFLEIGESYPLKFWEKDNPSNWGKSSIYFKPGPPPAQ